VVDDRIRPALESGAAIGSSKPVLVVIDEIDGATGVGDSVRLVGYPDSAFRGS
jgi:chromosome transmission fidelity protein 18